MGSGFVIWAQLVARTGFVFPSQRPGLRRVAATNHAVWQAFQNNRPCSDNGLPRDFHARSHKNRSADPNAIAKNNRPSLKGKAFIAEIMVACAKECPLGDTAMRSDRDSIKAQQIDLLADPAMVSDFEPPWHGDVHSWSDYHALADACSENSQEPSFDAGWPRKRAEEENDFQNIPCRLDRPWTSSLKGSRNIEFIQADSGGHFWHMKWKLEVSSGRFKQLIQNGARKSYLLNNL